MATLTPTLTLASTDISASETLNLTLTDSLAVLGPVVTKRLAIDSAATDLEATNVILLAASYSKSYVLLYNTSTAASGEIVTVGTAVASGGSSDEDLLATASAKVADRPIGIPYFTGSLRFSPPKSSYFEIIAKNGLSL